MMDKLPEPSGQSFLKQERVRVAFMRYSEDQALVGKTGVVTHRQGSWVFVEIDGFNYKIPSDCVVAVS